MFRPELLDRFVMLSRKDFKRVSDDLHEDMSGYFLKPMSLAGLPPNTCTKESQSVLMSQLKSYFVHNLR